MTRLPSKCVHNPACRYGKCSCYNEKDYSKDQVNKISWKAKARNFVGWGGTSPTCSVEINDTITAPKLTVMANYTIVASFDC